MPSTLKLFVSGPKAGYGGSGTREVDLYLTFLEGEEPTVTRTYILGAYCEAQNNKGAQEWGEVALAPICVPTPKVSRWAMKERLTGSQVARLHAHLQELQASAFETPPEKKRPRDLSQLLAFAFDLLNPDLVVMFDDEAPGRYDSGPSDIPLLEISRKDALARVREITGGLRPKQATVQTRLQL